MISIKIAAIIAIAAFASGSVFSPPVQEAIAAVIATDVQCTGCVGSNDLASSAVTTTKLAPNSVNGAKVTDQSLSAADLGPDSVGASELKGGAVGYAEVSRAFIAVEHRVDCNCGGKGWDPDGTQATEAIFDDRISQNSVVSISLDGANYGGFVCWASSDIGFAFVICNKAIPQGFGINYAIFKNPAYD